MTVYPRDVLQLQEKVRSVTDRPIRYVLNTHQHPDHAGGNATLLAANAQILMHKNARANMAERKMPGLPPITCADELAVVLDGKEVIAHHFGRGHTNGDSVIYFPSEKVLHAGDLARHSAIPVRAAASKSGTRPSRKLCNSTTSIRSSRDMVP